MDTFSKRPTTVKGVLIREGVYLPLFILLQKITNHCTRSTLVQFWADYLLFPWAPFSKVGIVPVSNLPRRPNGQVVCGVTTLPLHVLDWVAGNCALRHRASS